jgi:hypothetical protein
MKRSIDNAPLHEIIETKVVEDTIDIKLVTKLQLQEIAESNGIVYDSKCTKQELYNLVFLGGK